MTNEIEEWARAEFGSAALGDQRRTSRLVVLAAAAARHPHGTVTGSVPHGALREGAYRFLESKRVCPQAVGASMFRATARRARELERVVVPVDQSTVSITDRSASKGLGRTGRSSTRNCLHRGFEVMTAWASSPDGRRLGILGQEWHVRSDELSPLVGKDRRPEDERESGLWLRCMKGAAEALRTHAPGCRPWFQLDRGADIGHVLEKALAMDADVTVRSAHNRRLDGAGKLHETLRRAAPLGEYSVTLVDSHAPRGTPRQRQARLVVRAKRVVLRLATRHGDRRGALPLTAVHVTEAGRGRNSGLEWFLLTNVVVATANQARQVVLGYQGRWSVEEFHRAWKGGLCSVEKSQLRSAAAFRRWATILAAVASRSEQLKTLSRAEPKRDARDAFSQDELDAIYALSETLLHKNVAALGSTVTLEKAVETIAFLGGYVGRTSSGGPPGATVIGRGLERVAIAAAVLAGVRKKSG